MSNVFILNLIWTRLRSLKELVGEAVESKDGIISQEVVVYKISVQDTQTNVYGETVGGKVYKERC